jgi:hypothetical protein
MVSLSYKGRRRRAVQSVADVVGVVDVGAAALIRVTRATDRRRTRRRTPSRRATPTASRAAPTTSETISNSNLPIRERAATRCLHYKNSFASSVMHFIVIIPSKYNSASSNVCKQVRDLLKCLNFKGRNLGSFCLKKLRACVCHAIHLT